MAAMFRGRRAAIALLGMVLVGCDGGDAAPASCLTVHPCGGDLIGTWRFVGACAADTATFTAFEGARCAGSTVSSVGVSVSGSITFNADLTYSARGWNAGFNEAWRFPESCADGTTCAEHSLSVTSSDGSFTKRTCSGSDVCSCTTSNLSTITETGTYATIGQYEFRLDGPDTSRTRRYCVKDALLHIIELGVTSTDPTTPVVVLMDSVATRL